MSTQAVTPNPAVAQGQPQHENVAQVAVHDVVGFFEWIGKHLEMALKDVQPYLVPAEKLVALLFPSVAPAAVGVGNAVSLIQQGVVLVEQKYAALHLPTSTPDAVKIADVVQLTAPTVKAELAKEGIHYNDAQVANVVSAVVAVLKAKGAPTVTAKG